MDLTSTEALVLALAGSVLAVAGAILLWHTCWRAPRRAHVSRV
jgi:hypothetical protein